MPQNRQILLDNRPVGDAIAANFKLVTTHTPELGELAEGQVLVRPLVTVSLAACDGKAVVTVRDQGEGIAPEDQLRIFAPFERAGSKDVREGLGLGLYIARQLAESHGGTLDVRSAPDQGAAFILSLPLDSSQLSPR